MKSVKIRKNASVNPSQNFSLEIPKKTTTKSSKVITNEGNCFTHFFQKITCSNRKLIDDESEILIISNTTFK